MAMKRITPDDIKQYGVEAAPDKLTGTAKENKMVFDRLIREVVAGAVNAVIDQMQELDIVEDQRAEAEEARREAEEARQEAEELRQNTFREEVEETRGYKEGAEQAAASVGQLADEAEAWAVGRRNGREVSSLDPAYRNNAKFYKDQAKAIASGNDVFVFRNVTVQASEWMASTKHRDFPWEADTPVKGVTEKHIPFVTFDHIDSATYGLGTVADTGNETLTIYAVEKPGQDLVIPQVVFIEEGINNVREIVEEALEEAKASGEFDGEPGAVGPQGPKGDPGPAGANGTNGTNGKDGKDGSPGRDGVSPTVAVTTISGGHRVTITDVNGTKTFDVKDGKDGSGSGGGGADGKDGFSPIVTITQIEGGHRVTIEDLNGLQSFDVKDGKDGADGAKGDKGDTGATGPQGPKGEQGPAGPEGPQGPQGPAGANGNPGYTPQRGTDYWTAADIAEIKGYVDDAILGGEW